MLAAMGGAALLLVPAAPLGACVCLEPRGLLEAYHEARAVFAGRVIALHVVGRRDADRLDDEMVATFAVERRWKGPMTAQIRVRTCGTQELLCTCGIDFSLGARFVVFAVGEPSSTSRCERTRAYQRVAGDAKLRWIGVEDLVRELDAIAAPARRLKPGLERVPSGALGRARAPEERARHRAPHAAALTPPSARCGVRRWRPYGVAGVCTAIK